MHNIECKRNGHARQREDIKTLLNYRNIDITAIQETRTGEDTREASSENTRYYSGRNRNYQEYIDGTAIVINNIWIKHILDVAPSNDSHVH